MKSLLLCVIFGALALFSDAQLINDNIRTTIEQFRDQMACGIPDSDGRILAPLDIEHVDFNLGFEGQWETTGYMENVRVEDLDKFEIEFVNFSLIRLRIFFIFVFADIPVSGWYNMSGILDGEYPFHGSGPYTVLLHNVTMDGVMSLNLIDGFLNMREFDTTMIMESFTSDFQGIVSENGMSDEFMRELIDRVAVDVIEKNQEYVSERIGEFLMPIANRQLNNMTTSDLLNPPEMEPCVPGDNLKFKMN